MKSKLILMSLALVLGLGAFPGCASAPRIIEASSTKIDIQAGKNKGISVVLPKELDATDFDLSVDPKTGVITLKSKTLISSSQGVIDRAGAANAQAVAELSKSVNQLIGAVAPLLVGRLPVPLAAAAIK